MEFCRMIMVNNLLRDTARIYKDQEEVGYVS